MKNSNTDTDRLKEIKKGVKKTAPYILSHHSEENLDRCYNLNLLGKEFHLCSRCTGIYAGIITAFISFTFLNSIQPSTVFLLALPTALEKYMTDIRKYSSRNYLRIFNGVLLGFAYVWGVKIFVENPLNPAILATAIVFCFFGLLVLKKG